MGTASSIIEKFIRIYSIPIEEGWDEYLSDNYKNFYAYMVGLQIVDPDRFDIKDKSTYLIRNNPGLKTYFRKYSSYIPQENVRDKVVMDIGCGFGFLSFWFLLCGAKAVNAVGFHYQTEFIDKLKAAAGERGLLPAGGELITIARPLEKSNQTVGGMKPCHADLIVYIEVFEHIPDEIFQDAMTATFNTLKPGGLVVGVCHNTDNKSILSGISKGWEHVENSGLIDYRKKLICERIPDIAPDQLNRLALLTRGMMLKEFDLALEEFQLHGKLPSVPERIRPAVDLSYDYIMENYISPPQIISQMKAAGFNAKCYPGIRHSRRYMVLWPFEKLFRGILMRLEAISKTVVFVGKRPV